MFYVLLNACLDIIFNVHFIMTLFWFAPRDLFLKFISLLIFHVRSATYGFYNRGLLSVSAVMNEFYVAWRRVLWYRAGSMTVSEHKNFLPSPFGVCHMINWLICLTPPHHHLIPTSCAFVEFWLEKGHHNPIWNIFIGKSWDVISVGGNFLKWFSL
jgi:hypothetical protein